MKNRGKFSTIRQTNNNNKAQNDDDNCSVVCYKDSNDSHVGVVRIRQQPVCSACNLMRGTLSLYNKHVLENNHRENVKKQCDENRFIPSIYDQAIHLAFHNNFYYQSDKFHFLYKHTNEEPISSSLQQNQLSTNIKNEHEKVELTHNQQKSTAPNTTRKRRNLQVTLVFQDKTYSQIGTNTNQIREQLLKEMIADRASDIAALPIEIYYIKKKIASDNIHHNAQKSSIIFTMVKDQSQVLLKKQQQQEPFENGDMSSANNSSKDNGVEQNTIMTTHDEISNTEKIDVDEPPSFVDDIINVCKDVLNTMTLDIYSKCGELKREQQFLSGIARRSFKKKNTFFCDICSIFLTSEKYCIQHLNGSDHLEKICHYRTSFLPWRQAIQESIVNGKSMKDIMGNDAYENYKTTMALYLAPNSLSSRGRFCCAYCELVLTDQWALEKHLHTIEHQERQTSLDHKDLVVKFSNIVIIPSIFKLNGITQLAEIPDDIKNRYQWRCVTREQLDDDTNGFIRNYPFDSFEGATRIVNAKQGRKTKSSTLKSTTQNLRNNNANNKSNAKGKNQQKKRNGLNNIRGGQFQTTASHREAVTKRTFQGAGSPNKRFRGDVNNSFPGVNRAPGPIRNYEINRYNYDRPGPYNNGNARWSTHHSVDQRREEFFERSNYELQSLASNTNRYHGNSSRPSQLMSVGNNYEHEQQSRFNSNTTERYDNRQSNYDPNFIRAVAKAVAEYHPEPNSIPPYTNTHQRSNPGPTNEFIHQVATSIQRSQQPPTSIMSQGPYQNSNSLGRFGVNNNNNNNTNTNASYFSNVSNQQQQQPQLGNNVPPIRSYADYRASTGPSISNVTSSMYPPLANPQNPVVPQSHTFDDYNRSSNTYGRSRGSSFSSEEPRYNNFGHQNHGLRGQASSSFQSMNKQPGSTFSYSSTHKNNNNNTSMRGRGISRNAHNYGSRY